MWAYAAGGGVAVLGLAGGGGGGGGAAPAPAAPDTTAPTPPTVQTVAFSSTKSAAGSSAFSVNLSSVPSDASTVTVELTPSGSTTPITLTRSGSTGNTYTAAGVADGAYTLKVTYKDAAGNASSYSTATTLDTIAPAATATTTFTQVGTGAGTGSVTVDLGTSVPSDVATTTIQIELLNAAGTVVGTATGASSHTFINLAEGSYSARITYADAAGNTTTAFASAGTVALDTAPPLPNAATDIVTTSAAAVTPNTSDFTVELKNLPADVLAAGGSATVTLKAGQQSIPATGSDPATHIYTFSGVTDGQYTLEVAYTDAAGHLTTYTSPSALTIDNWAVAKSIVVKDTGTIEDPATSTVYTTDGTITVTINDPSITSLQYVLDGTPPVTINSASFTVDAATGDRIATIPSATTNGAHTVNVQLFDAAHPNGGPVQTVTYDRDNLGAAGLVAPTMTVLQKANQPAGATVGGVTYTADGNLSFANLDASVYLVHYVVDGNDFTLQAKDAAGLPLTSVTTPTPLDPGQHSIVVYQEDMAGNTWQTSAPFSVFVDPVISPFTSATTGTTGVDLILAPGARSNSTTIQVPGLDPNIDTLTALYTVAGSAPVAGTVVLDAINHTATVSYNGAPIPSGAVVTVDLTQTDLAGNSLQSGKSLKSPISLTLDTLAPSAPTAYSIQATNPLHPNFTLNLPADIAVGDTLTLTLTPVGGGTPVIETLLISSLTSALTITPQTALTQGVNYDAVATLLDAAGNLSTPLSFGVDLTAPALPVLNPLTYNPATPSLLSGSMSFSNVTGATALAVGDTVTVVLKQGLVTVETLTFTYPDAASVSNALATGQAFSFGQTAALSNGTTYTAEVSIRDAAGNAATSQTTVSALFDNTVAQPTLTLVDAADPTGGTGTDVVVSSANGSVSVAGLEAGAAVSYTLTNAQGTAIPGTVTNAGNGAGTIALTGLTDGAYTLTVTQTDAAGNTQTSTVQNLIIDNTAPSAELPVAGQSGLNGANLISNGNFNVTLDANAFQTWYTLATAAVAPAFDPATWLPVTGTAGSTVALALPAGMTLADGTTYTIATHSVDLAGNITNSSTTFVFDGALPTISTAPALINDTASAIAPLSDKITADGSISLTATDANLDRIEYTLTVNGQTSAASTILDAGTGVFTIPSPPVGADGAYTVSVTAFDKAGNASAAQTFSYTLDTTVAPLGLALVRDNGIPGDNITTAGSVKVLGTVEAGAQIEYGTMVGGVLTWSTSFNAVNGINNVWVRQTDLAGNVSAFDPAVPALIFDLQAGGTPPILSVNDTGTLETAPAAVVTNSALISITDTAFGGTSTTAAWSTDGITFRPFALTNGTGTLDLVAEMTLAGLPVTDGLYTVYVNTRDPAGLSLPSAEQVVDVIIDTALTTVTATPTDTAAAANPAGSTTDLITNNGTITLSNIDPNVAAITFEVRDAAGLPLQPPVTGNVTLGGATVSLDLRTLVPDGVYTVAFTQTDKAGNGVNGSSITTTAAITLDTTLVAATVALTTDTGTTPDNISQTVDLSILGIEPGATGSYILTDAAGTSVATGALTIDVNGNASIAANPALADGTYTATVTLTDIAGNAKNTVYTFVKDTALTTVTATPVDTAAAANPAGSTTDLITFDGTITLTNVDPNVAAITYAVLDAAGQPLPTPVTGNVILGGATVSLDLRTLVPDGVYTVAFTQTDKAGNLVNGAAATTTTAAITLDTTLVPATVALTTDTANPANAVATGADAISSNVALSISGIETGATGSYILTDAAGATVGTGALTIDVNGNASIAADPALVDGAYTATVTLTDIAGNAKNTVYAFVKDTSVLTAAGNSLTMNLVDTFDPANPYGTNADRISSNGLLSLTNLDPNVDTVTFSVIGVSSATGATVTQTGNVTVVAGQVPTLDLTALVGDGRWSVSITQTDKAGNAVTVLMGHMIIVDPVTGAWVDDPANPMITLDTTAPAVVPVAFSLANNDSFDPNNFNAAQQQSADLITNTPVPDVHSEGLPNVVEQFSADNGVTWTSDIAALIAANSNAALQANTFSFQTRAIDLAGNITTFATPFTFTVDTQTPKQNNIDPNFRLDIALDPAQGGAFDPGTGQWIFTPTAAGAATPQFIITNPEQNQSTFFYQVTDLASNVSSGWLSALSGDVQRGVDSLLNAAGVAAGNYRLDLIQVDAAGNGLNPLDPLSQAANAAPDASLSFTIRSTAPRPDVKLLNDSGVIYDTTSNDLTVTVAAGLGSIGATNFAYAMPTQFLDYATASQGTTFTWTPLTSGMALPLPTADFNGVLFPTDANGVPQITVPFQMLYYVQQSDALGRGVIDFPVVIDNFVAAPQVSILDTASNVLLPIDGATLQNVSRTDLVWQDPNGEATRAEFFDVAANAWAPLSQFHASYGLNTVQIRQIDAAGNVSQPTQTSFNLTGTDGTGAANSNVVWTAPQVMFTDTGKSASDHVFSSLDANGVAVNYDPSGIYSGVTVMAQYANLNSTIEWAVVDTATSAIVDVLGNGGWNTTQVDPVDANIRQILFRDPVSGNPIVQPDVQQTILVRESYLDVNNVMQYSPKSSFTFTFEDFLTSGQPVDILITNPSSPLGTTVTPSMLTPSGYDVMGPVPTVQAHTGTGMSTISFLVESKTPLWDRGTTFNGLQATINDGLTPGGVHLAQDGQTTLGYTGLEYITEYVFTDTTANIDAAIAAGLVPSLTLNVSSLGSGATNPNLVENFVHLDLATNLPVYDAWRVLPTTP